MISMTAYWQQFKECIDTLPISSTDEEYARQISTAQKMVDIGLTIEQLGITEIQQVVGQLQEQAKFFQHKVVYTAEQEYTFYLPKITNTANLVFAIVYYQHLCNYQHVSYQGVISWFKKRISDGVNQKKITTAVQAQALLQEICHYCQNQNIAANESLFLKNQEESIKDYISRISITFNKDEKPSKDTSQDSNPINEIARLEESLEQVQAQCNKLQRKTNSIAQKLSALNKARQTHHALTEHWQNKWLLTRSIFWLISLFFVVPAIKNLKRAEEQLIKAENELHQEIPQKNIESYIVTLQKQQQKLKSTHDKIQNEITQKKETQQAKQKEKTKNLSEHPVVSSSQKIDSKTTATETNEPSPHVETSSNDYYGFFTSHLPSRYVLQAIGVGAAAIAIQNLL